MTTHKATPAGPMKALSILPHLRHLALLALLILGSNHMAQAQTWVPTAAGTTYDWNLNTNWTPDTVPNAIGATVTWADIVGAQTVRLQQDVTVGNLTFGDAVGSQGAVTIANGTGGPWTLTLDNTTGNASVLSQGTANNTISADVAFADTVDFTTLVNATLSGNITGSGGLNKEGLMTLTLSGSSVTYTGATVVNGTGTTETNASTLTFGTGVTGASSSSIAVNNNAILRISAVDSFSSSVPVLLRGGTLNWADTNATFAAGVKVNAFGGDKVNTLTGINFTSTITHALTGSKSVPTVNLGSGMLTLSVTNGAASDLTITAFNRMADLKGTVTIPTLSLGGVNKIFFGNAPTPIGGTLGTTKAGVVPWVFINNILPSTYEAGIGFRALTASEYVTTLAAATAGDNVLLGAVETLGGNLTVNSFGMQGATGNVNLDGHVLSITSGLFYGPIAPGQRLTLQNGTINFGSAEGIINGVNTIESKISGTGGLTFSGRGGTRLSSGSNDFTGGVVVNSSLVLFSANEVIPDSNVIRIAEAGLLQFGLGFKETIAGLAGTGRADIITATNIVVIGATEAGAANTFTLTTDGTLRPGNNSGSTDLLPGQLKLNTHGGTGTVALNAGTMFLDLNSATSFDSVAVTATTVAFGVSGTTLDLALNYAPVLGSGFLIFANDGVDLITGKFSNGDFVSATYNSTTYDFAILYNTSQFGGTGNDIALHVIPEPSTLALVGIMGLSALCFLRRRKH